MSWIVTLDVLKYDISNFKDDLLLLNSNIRCIEIYLKSIFDFEEVSWIVTLDVLKLYKWVLACCIIELNSNIRCIEMIDVTLHINYIMVE